MERFMITFNGWKPLTIITKHSILDVAAVLDPPLGSDTGGLSEDYQLIVNAEQGSTYNMLFHARKVILFLYTTTKSEILLPDCEKKCSKKTVLSLSCVEPNRWNSLIINSYWKRSSFRYLCERFLTDDIF